MHTNVQSMMLSNDSGSQCAYIMYVCMHDITLISGHHVIMCFANVGVTFEHSYYTCERIIVSCTNVMGVRCSLLVTALF